MKLNCDNNDLGTWATTRCYYDEGPTDDLDSVNTAGWSRRRKLFGGIVKSPATVKNEADEDVANPELNKFKYGPMAQFFIGTLDHFLPQPPFLANTDIHIELELSKPAYVFQSETDDMTDMVVQYGYTVWLYSMILHYSG